MKRLLLTISVMCLASCGALDDDAPPLQGERISVLELQKSLQPDSNLDSAAPITIPNTWHNEFWPQAGGYPNHSMQHLAFNDGEYAQAWRADIGQGSTDELPLVASPVVVDQRIFTLDTDSNLAAFNTQTGKQLWRVNIRDEKEDDPVIGGGMAFSNAVLYVTNGYDELLAIDPVSGEILWRKDLPAPSRAAPTIIDDRLYLVTLDSRVMALNPSDGALLWEYVGIGETAGLVGAASPAANFDIVVPVFSSGEVTALRVENGSAAWSDNLSNVRVGGGLSSLSDIKAMPVIDKGMVIAISFSGRIVAIDERTGQRIWQREFGGSQTPWVAGDFVYVLSSDNELVALNRETGSIRWVTPLGKFVDEDRDEKLHWNGPVLAGGRLFLASSNGRILEVAPESGDKLAENRLGKSFALAPVVADKTLYLLAEDGTLLAFR
ncbi:MAG: PQQ-binding-like beta-propeller repeat protein [Alphaproteobacteria bacterium]